MATMSEGPIVSAVVVAPADATVFTRATRALYIGVGGDVSLVLVGSPTPVVFKNVPSGTTLNVRAVRVRSTGTTATDILSLS